MPKAGYGWDHPLKSGPRSGTYRFGAAPSCPAASHKARAEQIDLEFESKCHAKGNGLGGPYKVGAEPALFLADKFLLVLAITFAQIKTPARKTALAAVSPIQTDVLLRPHPNLLILSSWKRAHIR